MQLCPFLTGQKSLHPSAPLERYVMKARWPPLVLVTSWEWRSLPLAHRAQHWYLLIDSLWYFWVRLCSHAWYSIVFVEERTEGFLFISLPFSPSFFSSLLFSFDSKKLLCIVSRNFPFCHIRKPGPKGWGYHFTSIFVEQSLVDGRFTNIWRNRDSGVRNCLFIRTVHQAQTPTSTPHLGTIGYTRRLRERHGGWENWLISLWLMASHFTLRWAGWQQCRRTT